MNCDGGEDKLCDASGVSAYPAHVFKLLRRERLGIVVLYIPRREFKEPTKIAMHLRNVTP
jgi:hypothetical protein